MRQKERTSKRHGGVSPTRGPGLGQGPVAGAVAAPAHPDFIYNGGAVIRNPQVFTTFWGPLWSDAAHTLRSQRLNQFVQDLLNSQYMNVLSQYGVGVGAGSGGFVGASSLAAVPAQLDENSIAAAIQSLIDAGSIPEPPTAGNNIVLIVYLDETIAVNQPGLRMCEPNSDDAFGFHFDFVTRAGNEFYYAVIPALQDACIQNTCGAGGCSLSLNQTQEQRLTQVTSHEFAGMCTDPKFTAGWFGKQSDEDGDICNGMPGAITVGPNTWNVQLQYSKNDDENSGGTRVCVLGANAPMPKRADGPA